MRTTTSPARTSRPPSTTSPIPKLHRTPRFPKENLDPNTLEFPLLRSPAKPLAPRSKAPLPPRPPPCPSAPRRKPPHLEAPFETYGSDVKVILRMRPLKEDEEGEPVVKKVSDDSVCVADHAFTFDAVMDANSKQQEAFEVVGLPLVENCLAGFNSSIFAYGQTGSGKTYTMWGSLASLAEDESTSQERGLTTRVFERLFDSIKEEKIKNSDKELSYTCKCSFLQIYNEQITDLLDTSHGNLQIREDVRTGVYVENLTESYVYSVKDVIQLLRKGLENRRMGATSVNAESSRSHCIFTCIVDSLSKCISSGSSSVRTSRINLVDLAGSERQKQTGAEGERLKEAGNINRSLSQLGNLINILAETSQSGKQRHIPYRDSKLTFLLQESLGGNAKLAMICAVSPSHCCKSETFSTLRFAKRAKAIKTKAVVNETTQDDVNVLREQIRQLKDELLRVKSVGGSTQNSGCYSTGWQARRSLALLRQSLSRPKAVQLVEDDNDEEMEIDEADVEKSFIQSKLVQVTYEDTENHTDKKNTDSDNSKIEVFKETALGHQEFLVKDLNHSTCSDAGRANDMQNMDTTVLKFKNTVQHDVPKPSDSKESLLTTLHPKESHTSAITSLTTTPNVCLDIVPCQKFPMIKSSVSMSATQARGKEMVMYQALSSSMTPTSVSNNFRAPTEQLAKSLHRGLEIFDHHQQKSPLRKSSFPLSPRPVYKVDCGTQTLHQASQSLDDPSFYICSYCKSKALPIEYRDVTAEAKLQIVPVDSSSHYENTLKQVPKAVEKVLAGAIRREMALEDHCTKQAAEIAHLNRLVRQYKHERECNIAFEQTRQGKICRLESLMDGIIPAEHYMEEEFISLANEHKLLKEKYDNHPEILRIRIELKRVQDELDEFKKFFDLGEREVLVEEIQDLRCQLQCYIDSSSSSQRRGSLLKLTYDSNSVGVYIESNSTKDESSVKCFEDERARWTEIESKWSSLSEELQRELEDTRSLAEKHKVELDSERKCLAELKEALQTAMDGHACILEQYADLEEKHVELLARHRKIRDGITNVRKSTSGTRGAESKFIDSLTAEIFALKAERERERKYWKDENKGLKCQLRDTVEAVQAAGEVLARLKEAEEEAALAQKRIAVAENEVEKCHLEIESLKKKHEVEIAALSEKLAESPQLPKEETRPAYGYGEAAKYDSGGNLTDQTWREEFEPFCQGIDNDFSRGAEHHSWFSDYDRCNI